MMIKQNLLFIFLFLNLIYLNQAKKSLKDDLIYKRLYLNSTYQIANVNSPQCTSITDENRVDCYPEITSTEYGCKMRGCCWSIPDSKVGNPPYCYFPRGFEAYKITDHKENDNGQRIELIRQTPAHYPNTYQTIFIEIIYLNENSLRIRFNTTQAQLFVPPIKLDLPEFDPNKKRQYDVEVKNNIINVYRKQPRNLIWSADLNTLILSEQFNQIFTTINSNTVHGLGEHIDSYEKQVKGRKQILFFNRDQPPYENLALYGHHPFYYQHEINSDNNKTTNAHSVLLFNTHPIELTMMNKPGMLWRALGGTFDFFINMGPTPMAAIQQHVQIVGKPPLVPYWSLGFHLCRYGYETIGKAKEVIQRTLDNGVPLDTMWLDIDFQVERTMFKLNHNAWPGFRQWIDDLKSKDVKFIPIIDPGIDDGYNKEEYPYYDEGVREDVFIKHDDGSILKSKVWSKALNAWVDFTNPRGQAFWKRSLKKWHNEVAYDGLWIDMNEPAQEYDGSSKGCPWQSKYEHPQYIPALLNSPLAKKTACMTAKHHAGIHYDLHNLYSYYEVIATRQALIEMKKRPFIISRATVTGFGRYGSHWTGDVFSSWSNLQASIPNMLEFNLFGIPVVGADICGFIENTWEELCSRWSTLGAFYPFSRNHNTIGTRDQDPVAMGPVVTEAARSALKIRYSLLPLLYTELWKSSQDGRPVARALNFVWPDDQNTYGIKNQFMWADKLMIVPAVEEGVRWMPFYFPKGVWMNYQDLHIWTATQTGEHSNIELPWEKIGVFVRGGSILATQDARTTTVETRRQKFRLLVVLDLEGKAKGELYWDDGESYDIEETKNYSYVEFEANNNVLTNKIVRNAYPIINIQMIDIVGPNLHGNSVKLNGKDVHFTTGENRISVPVDLNMLDQFKVQWS